MCSSPPRGDWKTVQEMTPRTPPSLLSVGTGSERAVALWVARRKSSARCQTGPRGPRGPPGRARLVDRMVGRPTADALGRVRPPGQPPSAPPAPFVWSNQSLQTAPVPPWPAICKVTPPPGPARPLRSERSARLNLAIPGESPNAAAPQRVAGRPGFDPTIATDCLHSLRGQPSPGPGLQPQNDGHGMLMALGTGRNRRRSPAIATAGDSDPGVAGIAAWQTQALGPDGAAPEGADGAVK